MFFSFSTTNLKINILIYRRDVIIYNYFVAKNISMMIQYSLDSGRAGVKESKRMTYKRREIAQIRCWNNYVTHVYVYFRISLVASISTNLLKLVSSEANAAPREVELNILKLA